MNWKSVVKDYFTFTRKERIGIWILIALIVIVWISPTLISRNKAPQFEIDSTWLVAAKKLEGTPPPPNDSAQRLNEPGGPPSKYAAAKNHDELFLFDPNTLTVEGWKKLGVREKTAVTIQNYLRKGGHFNQPPDLQKIYGLRGEDYLRLKPYIRIEPVPEGKTKQETPVTSKQAWKKPAISNVDINTADTTAFIALPGIGSKLAARIVNFREKLGGFYSVGQVQETYGLPDSTFQKIRSYLQLKDSSVKTININAASKDELKTHPYIRWNLANAIVEYRDQHGKFMSLEDLKKITLLTDDLYRKLVHYLSLAD